MWFCPPKKLSHSTSNNRYVICVIPPFQPVTYGSYTRLFAINTSRILGRFLVCEFFVRSGGKMFLWYLPVPFTICSSSFPRIHARFPGSEDRGLSQKTWNFPLPKMGLDQLPTLYAGQKWPQHEQGDVWPQVDVPYMYMNGWFLWDRIRKYTVRPMDFAMNGFGMGDIASNDLCFFVSHNNG